MHADTPQLLALSDGEPVDAALPGHVDDCARCRGEMAALADVRRRLRALPVVEPPPISARALRAASSSQRPRRRMATAFAAGLALAGVLSIWLALDEPPSPVAGPQPSAYSHGSRPATPVPSVGSPALALQRRSAMLESQWRALQRQTPAVRRLGIEQSSARLRSRLLALDAEQLAADSAAAIGPDETYWQRRVRLLDSLLDVERTGLLIHDTARYRVVPAATNPSLARE